MTRLLLLAVLLGALPLGRAQQIVTQEQCQQADVQLNQVYQQLRGSLNEAQKQKLKVAQRDWIKERDGLMKANLNPQYAFFWITTKRVTALKEVLQQIKAKSTGETTNIQTQKQTVSIPVQHKEENITVNSKKIQPCDDLQPYPQANHIVQVSCASVSNDGKYIVTGDKAGVVKIWDFKYGYLLRTINVGSQIIYARISPDNSKVFIINKERREDPKIFSFSLKNAEKLGECVLTGLDRQGECYISRDAKTILITGDLWLESDKIAYYKNPLEVISDIKEVKPEGIITKDNARRLLKEIDRKNIFDQFGTFYGGTNKRSVYEDELYLIESCNDCWSLIFKGFKTTFDYRNEVLTPDGIDLAEEKGRLLAFNKSIIKISNIITGKSETIFLRDCEIQKAVFSPDKNKILCLEKDSNGDYIAKIFDSDGILLNSKIITSFIHSDDKRLAVEGLSWVGSKIFISVVFGDLFSFTDNLEFIESYTKGRVKKIKDSAVIAVPLPIENPTIETPGHISLIDPISNRKINSLRYAYEAPSCKYLDPFDIDSDLCSLVKGYWWRGGGGLYVCSKDQVVNIDGMVFARPVQYCQYLDKSILISSTSNDGNQSNLQLISKQQPFSSIYSCDVPFLYNTLAQLSTESVWGIQSDGIITKYKTSNNKIDLSLSYLIGINTSIIFTPDLKYLSQGNLSKVLRFTRGLYSYPLEQFDLRLNRPDIVLERLGAPKEAIETARSLREKRLKRMGVTEEMLKPDFHLPELQIVGDVPATTAKDQLDLQIKTTDDKYPLDRLRVYVNNVPVNGRDGELLRDQKTQSLEKTIPIQLAAGRNKIQVSVLNSAGAESLYANAEVNCTAERPKPKLFAVALGVSQYDRPEWCLKYAAKDATDLIGKLKEKAGSSYSEVKPLLLTDKEVTKESAAKIKEFLSAATIDDTVVIFMAGHGLLDDKYDYYFGTTDIDPAKPSERGMPYEAIDTILAEVPSLKKALLMDTCHAGELDDDEKKELAASDGKGAPVGPDSPLAGKVAMRSIGTRGMQVKAIEGAKGKSDWYEKLQDMFVDLRRGSGATVISSSQGAEYAFESSEQSNGLFTYALMEALDGKATPNNDGQITISSVGDYVKKRVQDLTKGKQNPNLRGVNLEEDFVLGTAK